MSDRITHKIRIDLHEHPAGYAGESVWADLVENDIYEIINIPIFAYGVNFKDHVRVVETEDGILEVEDVVKKSEYHTIRVFFIDDKSGDENFSRLKEFKGEGIGSEQWNDDLYALNVPPERDYEEFIEVLNELQEQEIIEYELAGEWEGNFDGSKK